MVSDWMFDTTGPDASELSGPRPLAAHAMGLPNVPGLYVVTCGDCLAHVGTSGNLATRVRELAKLGVHHGTSDVLCATYCTRQPPLVRWQVLPDVPTARQREREFKLHYGEPPVPRDKYAACSRAQRLRQDLLEASGPDTWEAGYIEAVFRIGNSFNLLLRGRFEEVWRAIGGVPEPWDETAQWL